MLQCFLVSGCRLICPNAYSKSMVEMYSGMLSSLVFDRDTCPSSSSRFGICAFLLMVLSFNILASIAIFTELSFLTVMTVGDINCACWISFALLRWPEFINLFISLFTADCKCIGIRRPFCCTGLWSSFSSILTCRSCTV